MAFYCVTCQGCPWLVLVLDTGEVSCGRPAHVRAPRPSCLTRGIIPGAEPWRVGRGFLEGDPAAYEED
jgi:hypothetical protein